jgi:hypothetical protein
MNLGLADFINCLKSYTSKTDNLEELNSMQYYIILTAVAYLRLRVLHLRPQGCRQMRPKDNVLLADL